MNTMEELEKLNEKSKHAIKFLAAEFNYVKELQEEFEKLKSASAKEGAKEAKHMLGVYRWVANSERKVARDEMKIQHILVNLEKILPQEEKAKAEEYKKQLEIADGKLKRMASYWRGELKKELEQVETEEQLIAQLEEDPEHKDATKLKQKLDHDLSELDGMLKEHSKWVQSNTAIVEHIQAWNEHLQQLAS